MQSERWREVSRLYHAALERSTKERAAFLAEACSGDDALRREVESLLAEEPRVDAFMPAAAIGAGTATSIATHSLVGQRFGSFAIHSVIGRGGMGEVYRARDTRLGRDVAVKILPLAFTADAHRLARFEREARVLAAFNHPNIATIYGVEETDGLRGLVMELVDGETLAERIAHGPIPVADALAMATQMAEALDAAHERGIVHRDLKPANVKITPGGTVKVLDFGLAKAVVAAGAESQAPTTTIGATSEGVIVGTAAYMSPEQARGRAVDKRTDIWAFGCVVYEMLTGHRAFEGDDVTEVLANVVKTEPDWTGLPGDLPSTTRKFLKRCLQKDPRQRVRDIGDVRFALEGGFDVDRAHAPRITRRRWIAVAAATLVIGALSGWLTRGRAIPSAPSPSREMRLQIALPPEADSFEFAVSPDGSRLVYGAGLYYRRLLWSRAFDSDVDKPLEETLSGRYPFWSPTSESIGFFTNTSLTRLDLQSGGVQTVTAVPDGRRGAWHDDGTILYSSSAGPLFKVSSSGGTAQAATALLPGQTNHRWPEFIPGTREFLLFALGEPSVRGIYRGSLDNTAIQRVMASDFGIALLPSSFALIARDGQLWAQHFTPGYEKPDGDRIRVSPKVLGSAGVTGLIALSSSRDGSIVYRQASEGYQVRWLDSKGQPIGGYIGEPDANQQFTWSAPHRGLIPVQRTIEGNTDIYLFDLNREVYRRMTSDPAKDGNPKLSDDGQMIGFASDRNTNQDDLYAIPADKSAPERLLLRSAHNKAFESWSHDRQYVIYSEIVTSSDLWALPTSDNAKPFPIATSEFDELGGKVSPDGHWVAFISTESGRSEMYVQPFPRPGPKIQISSGGAERGDWSPDGHRLTWIAGRSVMTSPIVIRDSKVDVSQLRPRLMFDVPDEFYAMLLSPDDDRVLVGKMTPAPPLNIIMNWRPPLLK